jgi:hypothetical protein
VTDIKVMWQDSISGRIGSEVFAISTKRNVSLYSINDESIVSTLENHPTNVSSLSFDHKNESLVIGCQGGSVWVWDIESGTQVSSLPGHRSECSVVEYHPFGSFFATGSSDSNIKIWDSRQARCVQTYRGHMNGITACKFSPHGRWLISGDDIGNVFFWDLSSGKQITAIEYEHVDRINGIDFHPTDFFLITCSRDKTVKLWNCETNVYLEATSEPDTTSIEKALFDSKGECIYVSNLGGFFSKFQINKSMKKISLVDKFCARQEGWTRIYDMNGDGLILGHEGLWSANRSKDPKPGNDQLETKEPEPHKQLEEGGLSSQKTMIKEILANRLAAAKMIVSLFKEGQVETAIQDSFSKTDPVIFVSLIGHLIHDKRLPTISNQTFLKILNLIFDLGLLTLPYSTNTVLVEGMKCLPFSQPLPLVVGIESNNYINPSRASEFAFIVSVCISVVKRLYRKIGDNEVFERIRNVVSSDLKGSKFFKKEKESLIDEISA